MTTIIDEAKAYEPIKQTKNISDLKKVDINEEIATETGNKDGKDFSYKYIERQNEKGESIKYRIPNLVLGQIKTLLEEVDNFKYFKVIRSGEGKEGTKYQTIPLSI